MGWTLVTGGAGYVGSVLVSELIARGRRVRVLDSLVHGATPSLLWAWGSDRFEFIRGDVRDQQARRAALSDAEAVVHLAAVVGDPACAQAPELALSVNTKASHELLEDARTAGLKRFVFASTCSNYGRLENSNGALATESWSLNPLSVYAESKVAAERDVLSGNGRELATTCLRFATVYGPSPRMRFDLTVNEFTRDMLLSKKLLIYGEQFWRPYVHVADAARGIACILECPREQVAGEVFNVGDTEENYRKGDIVGLVRERLPEGEVEFVSVAEDPRDYRVSFAKVNEALGFSTKRRVRDGIDEIVALIDSGLLPDPFAPIYRNV